jgi:hypothetical protein
MLQRREPLNLESLESERRLLAKNCVAIEWVIGRPMKTRISRLRDEKRDVQRAEALATEISEYLSTDPLLLQPYLEVVLTCVLPTFGSLLGVDVRRQCCDHWILTPEFPVLSLIVSSLKSPSAVPIASHYLEKWTKRHLFSRTIDSVRQSQSEQLYSELLSVIFSIPDRIVSASSEPGKAPSLLKPSTFFARLSASLNGLDPLVLSKFAILRLMPHIWSAQFSVPAIAEAALGLTPSAVSPFVLSLLEETPKQTASSVLAVIYPSIDRLKYLLQTHFLTQKVLSTHALNTLVDFFIGQGETLVVLEKCAEVWSRHRLITQMSTSLHGQLSEAILRLLPRTTQADLQHSKATNLIMTGVSAHISISTKEIRQRGLQIGERITAILLPDQAVKFDELHPNEEEENNELAAKRRLDSSDSDSSDLDIDAPFKEGAVSDSSDEEFVPYAIDDDAGTDDAKVLHPRDLIALFRTDENDIDRFKKFQRAIASAADVIKKMTALEFSEFGGELLGILLSVDNEYNQDDFDDMRRAAFIALMTTFPMPAQAAVVAELRKKRTHALGRKLQLIAAISYAASEMSELPRPEKKEVTIIEAHTRRWGRARTKVTRVSAVNKFRDCGPKYFYGILSAVDIDRVALEEDGLEAAQVLTALAVIVEACGESVAEHQQLCTDLIDVAKAMMMIRPPNARRALVFAVSCAVRGFKEYRASDRQLVAFLEETLEHDPDEMCRELAMGVYSILAERHDEDIENLIPK